MPTALLAVTDWPTSSVSLLRKHVRSDTRVEGKIGSVAVTPSINASD